MVSALQLELPLPGAILGGKYRLERVLGEGVMGVVYEAVHERLGQRVAIKLPQLSILAEPALAERFEREARASARLRHRNSVRVMDVDVTSDGLPYLVMELLEGHDLESEVTARGQLPIGEAVGLIIQACAAMQEAHSRGIVHRDLKPSNMFLANEADGTVCLKVLDFGISKFQSEKVRLTAAEMQLGTPLYMSPEQVRSVKDVDHRTDIWSLGVILYELVSGLPPFRGSLAGIGAAIVTDVPTSIRELRPEIPEGLEMAINKAMAKKPSDRFASMQEMFMALSPFSTLVLPAETLRRSLSSYSDVATHPLSTFAAPARIEVLRATTDGTAMTARLAKSARRRKPRIVAIFGVAALAGVVFAAMSHWSVARHNEVDESSRLRALTAVSVTPPEAASLLPASADSAVAILPAATTPALTPVSDRSRSASRAASNPAASNKSPQTRTPSAQAPNKAADPKKAWDPDSPFPPP